MIVVGSERIQIAMRMFTNQIRFSRHRRVNLEALFPQSIIVLRSSVMTELRRH